MIYPEDVEFLEHFGKKGMKWGVRNESKPSTSSGKAPKKDAKPTNAEIKVAQQQVRAVGKNARATIKAARKAKTPEERKAAADKYSKEVNAKIRSKEFKDTWDKANRQTRGQMATQLVLLGPLGAANIAAIGAINKQNRQYGLAMEQGVTSQVLKELRTL